MHTVIQFNQSQWSAKNIDLNTEMRKKGTNDFEDFYKLMTNAVFGCLLLIIIQFVYYSIGFFFLGKAMESTRRMVNKFINKTNIVFFNTFLNPMVFKQFLHSIHFSHIRLLQQSNSNPMYDVLANHGFYKYRHNTSSSHCTFEITRYIASVQVMK